jgi:hypothetical protein
MKSGQVTFKWSLKAISKRKKIEGLRKIIRPQSLSDTWTVSAVFNHSKIENQHRQTSNGSDWRPD